MTDGIGRNNIIVRRICKGASRSLKHVSVTCQCVDWSTEYYTLYRVSQSSSQSVCCARHCLALWATCGQSVRFLFSSLCLCSFRFVIFLSIFRVFEEMGFDDGRIILDREDETYYTGQFVRGRLEFNLSKVKSFRGEYRPTFACI